MAGSGNETAGRGRLRASDADRERAVDVLKAAFVRGQLAKDEFDLRVGRVLTSRTCGDLDALTAGISAGPATAAGPEPATRNFAARAGIVTARIATPRAALLIAGALLLSAGLMLGSSVAFVAGMLIIGASAPDALPGTPTSAMVRTWQSLYKNKTGRL